MLREAAWRLEVSGVSLMVNHTLAFASEKNVHWSFIQRLSFTTQKWMKQLNSKNIIVFICLKFCIIFPCKILCKLFNIISNCPYERSLSFYYIMPKSMGVVSLFLRTGQMWDWREVFQKCQLHIACYDLTGYQSSLQFKGSTGFSLADNI